MIKFIAYNLAALAAAIFLLTYATDRISQPSDFSVFIGIVEALLAIILLALVFRYTYIQLKLKSK